MESIHIIQHSPRNAYDPAHILKKFSVQMRPGNFVIRSA